MSAINYDLSRLRAVVFDVDGVLSPATIPMDAEGNPMRMANIKDGYALQLAVKRGLKIAIITGADSPAVEKRFSALGIKDIFTRAAMKRPLLEQWMAENGLTAEETAYVGDDIPDYQPMEIVGLPIAPADAAEEIKQIARYISPARGGYGVARDVLEQVLRDRGQWMTDHHAFGW